MAVLFCFVLFCRVNVNNKQNSTPRVHKMLVVAVMCTRCLNIVFRQACYAALVTCSMAFVALLETL